MGLSSSSGALDSVELASAKRKAIELFSSISLFDLVFYLLILGIGACHVFSVLRASDFLHDDVFYADSARSLLHSGLYGIQGHPETNQPPGLPVLLALLCFFGLCTFRIFLRCMAVAEVLGLLVGYTLLRTKSSRAVAAIICLLLISSEVYVSSATRYVFPSYPYLFVSLSALLVAGRFERTASIRSRILWGVLLSILVVASILFASAGIAILGAILASLFFLAFRDRALALSRLRTYLPILFLGLAVQGFWMLRKPAPLEWPVQGYPRSYLAQLRVKSGNYPELGMATPLDVGLRVLNNTSDHASLLSRILLRRWIGNAWMSILILGPLLLVGLGWCYSVWSTGGDVVDWYFAGYELIYLLWPWDLERRFFIPIAPLAFLYLWRGGDALLLFLRKRPRLFGFIWLPVGTFAATAAYLWMRGYSITAPFPHAGLQDETSFATWVLSILLAAWMALDAHSWITAVDSAYRWFANRLEVIRLSPPLVGKILGAFLIAYLIGIGLAEDYDVARANTDSHSPQNQIPGDVEAAIWISQHAAPDAVVMARHVPITHHYARRNVVWFPPSSDPRLLMEGIEKHRVNFVVVVTRGNSYYRPPDEECFVPLQRMYPSRFRLAYREPGFAIFQVIRDGSPGLITPAT